MPIFKADATSIYKACANCGTEQIIHYSSLEAGLCDIESNRTNPNTSRLQPCPNCGAVEFLIRTWDVHPDQESHSAKHRALVNRIYKILIGMGRVESHCASIYSGETSEPTDMYPEDPLAQMVDIGKPLFMQSEAQP